MRTLIYLLHFAFANSYYTRIFELVNSFLYFDIEFLQLQTRLFHAIL
nr:MAG TPA: hypothetical protein [Caudoviricetes sp.]